MGKLPSASSDMKEALAAYFVRRGLLASCGMHREVTPCGQLRDLGRVGTGSPTYISEFGWEGRFVVGGLGMRAVLWEGVTPWNGMGCLAEEGLYG